MPIFNIKFICFLLFKKVIQVCKDIVTSFKETNTSSSSELFELSFSLFISSWTNLIISFSSKMSSISISFFKFQKKLFNTSANEAAKGLFNFMPKSSIILLVSTILFKIFW